MKGGQKMNKVKLICLIFKSWMRRIDLKIISNIFLILGLIGSIGFLSAMAIGYYLELTFFQIIVIMFGSGVFGVFCKSILDLLYFSKTEFFGFEIEFNDDYFKLNHPKFYAKLTILRKEYYYAM